VDRILDLRARLRGHRGTVEDTGTDLESEAAGIAGTKERRKVWSPRPPGG